MFRARSRCIIAAGTVIAIIIVTIIVTATIVADGSLRQTAGALAPAVLFRRG